jgi:hypothetical protein
MIGSWHREKMGVREDSYRLWDLNVSPFVGQNGLRYENDCCGGKEEWQK